MIISKHLIEDLRLIKGIKIKENYNVKDDNNLKIEAIFRVKVEVYSFSCFKELFRLIKENKIKYYVIGNGSNVLFIKDYYEAILIKLMPFSSKYQKIINGGELINYLNSQYLLKGISSLNFLSGIPCCVSGAIYMNAGCFNHSISEIIDYVYVFDTKTLKYRVFNNKQCKFAYRDSYFKHHRHLLILACKVKLQYLDKNQLLEQHHFYLKTRKEKMPLEYPNLGSIFKNPLSFYAARLIEDAKLKGKQVGGARVSEKHANVIINYDNAKGKDVLKLIRLIQREILAKNQIKLELEIIIFK